MTLGLGVDVVEVRRVAGLLSRRGSRFLSRCFAPQEALRPEDPQHLAGLLAAKEATFKALGTGWGDGVGWHDVVIERAAAGQPNLRLSGAAAVVAASIGVTRTHVSISHDGGLAIAVVILEA